MKVKILIISLLCPIILFGQGMENKVSEENDILKKYLRLTPVQLSDTANYYFNSNNYDTALICYNLLINKIPKNTDVDQQMTLLKAYTLMANIFFFKSDYRNAYECFIKALLIGEKYNFEDETTKTYTNLGIIYRYLNHYEMAKQYYLKALDLCKDSVHIVLILNNLGDNEINRDNLDSAFYFLNKSIQLSKSHENVYMHLILNNLAAYYQDVKQYDSAFNYFRSSLRFSKINKDLRVEATTLSDLGKLFFEVNKTDSALYYIDLSNKIATENNFLRIVAENHLALFEIDKSKGRTDDALNHYINYTNLKDSIYNAGVFGDVNQMQRMYEVSKTNQQIEQLVLEQTIKERTIFYQQIIWFITLGVLMFVISVLMIISSQKKNLDKANKALVEKNIKIVEIHKNAKEESYEKKLEKIKKRDKYSDLMDKIILVMENKSIYCNTEFSIESLADMVQSNQKYVSEAINNILNKNFRSFINSYRIQEAQRLFAQPEIIKTYTIETLAPLVGFKSPKTFREAFKEVTGVTPNYYLKTVIDQHDTSVKNKIE